MVITLVGLSTGMLEEQARRSRGVGADVVVRAPGSSVISLSANLSAKFLPFIGQQPNVTAATGVLIESTGFLNTITGIDLAGFNHFNGGLRYLQGGPFQGPNYVIVDSYYANEHNLHVNRPLHIINRSWRVSGIVEPGMLARVVVPLARLQELYSASNKLTIIYAKVDKPQNIRTVVDSLRAKLE